MAVVLQQVHCSLAPGRPRRCRPRANPRRGSDWAAADERGVESAGVVVEEMREVTDQDGGVSMRLVQTSLQMPQDDALWRRRVARRDREASRLVPRLLPQLALLPYAAAVALLLAGVPGLEHVLSTTPCEALRFCTAALCCELGFRCRRGFSGVRAALRRAEVEAGVWEELLGSTDVVGAAQGAAEAGQTDPRARAYALALALTAPVELAGAVMAALGPHPAPGIALLLAAQLPLRACAWQPGEGGAMEEVSSEGRRAEAAADALSVVLAAASGFLSGAWSMLAALCFAFTALQRLVAVDHQTVALPRPIPLA